LRNRFEFAAKSVIIKVITITAVEITPQLSAT
jgi:hypothetical protein